MTEKLYYSMGEITEMFDVTPALVRYWCEQFTCLRPKRNAKGNRLFTPKDVEMLKRIYHLLKEKKMTIEGAKRALRKRNQVEEGADPDIELLDHLQQLRSMLVELRSGLGGEAVDEDEAVPQEVAAVAVVEAAEPVEVVETVEPVEDAEAAEESTEEAAEEPTEEPTEEAAEEPIEEVVESAEAPIAEAPVVEAPEEVVSEQVAPALEGLFAPIAAPQPEEQPQEQELASVAEATTPEPMAEVAVAPTPKRARKPRTSKRERDAIERPLFPFFEQTLFDTTSITQKIDEDADKGDY